MQFYFLFFCTEMLWDTHSRFFPFPLECKGSQDCLETFKVTEASQIRTVLFSSSSVFLLSCTGQGQTTQCAVKRLLPDAALGIPWHPLACINSSTSSHKSAVFVSCRTLHFPGVVSDNVTIFVPTHRSHPVTKSCWATGHMQHMIGSKLLNYPTSTRIVHVSSNCDLLGVQLLWIIMDFCQLMIVELYYRYYHVYIMYIYIYINWLWIVLDVYWCLSLCASLWPLDIPPVRINGAVESTEIAATKCTGFMEVVTGLKEQT